MTLLLLEESVQIWHWNLDKLNMTENERWIWNTGIGFVLLRFLTRAGRRKKKRAWLLCWTLDMTKLSSFDFIAVGLINWSDPELVLRWSALWWIVTSRWNGELKSTQFYSLNLFIDCSGNFSVAKEFMSE